MELKTIWEIILRRKWIIIQAFIVISASAILGSYLLTPVYKTTSKILIKKTDSETYLLSKLNKNLSTKDFSGMKIEDHIELITSRPVLERVITKLHLTDRDGELIEPDSFRDYTWGIYEIFPKPCVEVEIVERDELDTESSNQIEITARATDPDEAAMIANTVAEEYIAENLKMKKEGYIIARRNIESQIGEVKAKYIKILKDIKSFKLNEKTIDIDIETQEAIRRMFELMKEKEDNIKQILEVRAEIQALKDQLNKQNEEMVSSSTLSENSTIEQIKSTIIELELQLEEELTEKKPDHPDVVILYNKMKKAKENLKKELENIKFLSSKLQELERELASLEAEKKGLSNEINKFMVDYYAIPEKAFGNSRLRLDYQVIQDIYGSLLDYLYDIGVVESAILPDVVMVEAAGAPDIDDPDSPDIVLNSIVGILFGLIFGFFLGFMVEYWDDSIKGVKEVKKYGLAVLGSVPKIKKRESTLILKREPRDKVAEFYRTIRNGLKFLKLNKSVKSLLITSATNGEGKSTITINLGTTFAREGKKVLLIDADFCNPKLDEILLIPKSNGLTDILMGGIKPEEAIKDIQDIVGMDLLSSGSSIPHDPSLIIESEKMNQLLTDLNKQYDIIILDSSPILISNDAISLAKYVDTTVLVVESGKISRHSFSRITDHLNTADIKGIGVILNKFKIKRRGELL
jgi:capsular exopolysaccharide synthesis family protein